MAEIDSHTLVRLGLAAFILAGALFIALIPSFLIAQLTVLGSVSLLLLLWIFIWVAMIIALAIGRVGQIQSPRLSSSTRRTGGRAFGGGSLSRAVPVSSIPPAPPRRANPAKRRTKRRSRQRKRSPH